MFPAKPSLLLATCLAVSSCAPDGADKGGESIHSMGMMSGQSASGMPGGMMDRMMGGDHSMSDMASIHRLLASHEKIERSVENVPGGVHTLTVSHDPEVTSLIRRHVREMRARYERDEPIRMMDPVFRELFRHREKATMKIEDISGGIRVVHISDDPKVTALIRQHAHRFVSEAARQGMRRAMQPTPLPEGYPDQNGRQEAAE